MDGKKMFEKHYDRLAREGFIKALIFGLIAGFVVDFIVAFATWFTEFNGLWVAIGAGVLVAAVTTPLLYFKLFKPDAKSIARRIDRLGLEERLITMTELEKDQSYMAQRQREDAKEKLGGVPAKSVKFKISKVAIAAVAIIAAMGVSMTCVTSLSAEGLVPKGEDFVENLIPDPPPVYFEVSYLVEGGGYIEGEEEQVVREGEDATPVLAVAEDGWMFLGWDDTFADPYREDKSVSENLVFTAVFAEMEEEGESDEESDTETDSDQASDEPQEGENQNSGSQSQPQPEQQQPSDGGDSRWDDNNQILDGKTYYRDKYREYYEQAMEKLANGEELTPLERAIIEAYWDIIE